MSRRRGLLGCLATFLLLVALAALAALVLGARSRAAEEALLARWSGMLGGRSFPERFPPTEPNATALRLEALGAAMGVEMAHPDAADRPRPSEESAARLEEIGPLLKEHLQSAESAESRAARPPVPDAVGRFLVDVRPQIDRTVELLLAEPSPVWESDIARGFEAPIPNLLGVLRLQQIVAATAGDEIRAGREDRAVELLEASWALGRAVLDRPSIIAQLVGHLGVRRQAALLRSLCAVPEAWPGRLQSLELQRGIFIALAAEAFVAYHSAGMDPLPGEEFPRGGYPFLRWGLRDYARRYQAIIDDLMAQDVRTFDPDAFFEDAAARLPRWQFIARILLPRIFEAWPRSARQELEAELTGHVLRQRAELAERPAEASFSGARVELASRRVPGLDWLIESDAAGISIGLDGDLAHVREEAPPLRFRIESHDCPGPSATRSAVNSR